MGKAQAYVVTSTFLDDSMQLSVRRRVRLPLESWLRGLQSGSPAAPPLRNLHEDGDAVFEERRAIPEEDFLARRVISEVAYMTAVKLAPQSTVSKYVLSFQEDDGQHYELFYFEGRTEIILDFSVGAKMPPFLKELAEIRPHPEPRGAASPEKKKKLRVLTRHSTMEASHFCNLQKNACLKKTPSNQ